MSKIDKLPSRRIIELDLLRGFFILVIILDHLQFWPSPWQYLTGQGRLWVSAAEGFFLISGLLIGYLRAYKGSRSPLIDLSKNLWSRALLLYIWCVGITFFIVSITTLLPGDGSLLPKLPTADQLSSIPTYLINVFTTAYASDWIYFLRLYAIMLAVTPLFLLLIRKKLWWLGLLISISIYLFSLVFKIEEAAMQWQILFFGAAFIGWRLEYILSWLDSNKAVKKILTYAIISITLVTMVLSYFFVHGWSYVESPATSISRESYISIRTNVDPLFSNNPMVPARIGLSFVWFFGLLALFNLLRPKLLKFAGWLLTVFGQASLTAYCLQAILLGFVVTFIPTTKNFWINGLIGAAVVIAIWALMRTKLVKDVLPK